MKEVSFITMCACERSEKGMKFFMDLKEIRNKSKKMLAIFVNEIGLDGEFYVSTCNCPMTWGNPNFNSCGEFVTPGSKRLKGILQTSKCDEQTKKILNQRGLILINRSYRKEEPNPDLFVTIIHEMIHSNRNLLLFDATRDKKNENAYSFNNEKFEQNTTKYAFSYADASQEVLKGSIDTSKKTMNSYKNTTSENFKNMKSAKGKRDSQMTNQYYVDEALVELMSILSYNLYSNKEKGKTTNIWNAIEQVKNVYEGEEIGAICKIILKHHDFELFHWMIDPISYSQGDIHYDFFAHYTKEDQSLLQELYVSVELDEDGISEISESNEIDKGDIEEVATSPTAIKALSDSFQDIRNAQNSKKGEVER